MEEGEVYGGEGSEIWLPLKSAKIITNILKDEVIRKIP